MIAEQQTGPGGEGSSRGCRQTYLGITEERTYDGSEIPKCPVFPSSAKTCLAGASLFRVFQRYFFMSGRGGADDE